jgi:hypothetical protein
MPNGDISKICCAARDTNEHNNSLRSELVKSDISSFLNASVRYFKNKHAHMLHGDQELPFSYFSGRDYTCSLLKSRVFSRSFENHR